MAELNHKFQHDNDASNDVAVYGSCNPVHLYEKVKRIGGENHIVMISFSLMQRNHISSFNLEVMYRFNSSVIDTIRKMHLNSNLVFSIHHLPLFKLTFFYS